MSQLVVRGFAVLAAGGIMTLSGVAPALAKPCQAGHYPPASSSCSITVSTPSGQSVTVSVDGFAPGSQVSASVPSLGLDLGTFTADQSGKVTDAITLPAGTAPGTYTVLLTGKDVNGNPRSSTMTITVKGTGSTTGGGAASQEAKNAGLSTTEIGVLASVGVLAGGVLTSLVVARRRNQPAVEAE
jgi:hypothetical protein